MDCGKMGIVQHKGILSVPIPYGIAIQYNLPPRLPVPYYQWVGESNRATVAGPFWLRVCYTRAAQWVVSFGTKK